MTIFMEGVWGLLSRSRFWNSLATQLWSDLKLTNLMKILLLFLCI